MTTPADKLLREYVRALLTEDDFGTYAGIAAGAVDAYGPNGGGGGYGMHYGSGDDLYKIFVKPFADVVGVAAGKTKELSQKGQTALKVTFETIATTLVPILKDDYAEIFAKEKEQIDKIKGEYAEVYQATWDAFTHNDVLCAAFMYRPDLFLTAVLAKKAPKAVAKLLSVLSGGTLDKVLKKLDVTSSSSKHHESVIREDDQQSMTPLQKLVSNDKVKSVIVNSGKVKQMEQQGKQLVQGTLKQVYDHAAASMQAKSIADIQHKLGKKIPGVEKLAQIPENERQKAEQQILAGVKKGMKSFYVSQLNAHVKDATDAGVPQDHPLIQDYQKVISKIKAL